MRLLLDTNIVVMLAKNDGLLPKAYADLLARQDTEAQVSVIALWEISIKQRTGKLALFKSANELLGFLPKWGIAILPLLSVHVVVDPALDNALKDPFDHMFAAIAEVEDMAFLTTDRKLFTHRLGWQP